MLPGAWVVRNDRGIQGGEGGEEGRGKEINLQGKKNRMPVC